MACVITNAIAGVPSKVLPDKHVAGYVMRHLDLSTISSSVGPRRQEGKWSFEDYGFRPTSVTDAEAILKWKVTGTDKEEQWMDIRILKHTANSITIGLTDYAQNG